MDDHSLSNEVVVVCNSEVIYCVCIILLDACNLDICKIALCEPLQLGNHHLSLVC